MGVHCGGLQDGGTLCMEYYRMGVHCGGLYMIRMGVHPLNYFFIGLLDPLTLSIIIIIMF